MYGQVCGDRGRYSSKTTQHKKDLHAVTLFIQIKQQSININQQHKH